MLHFSINNVTIRRYSMLQLKRNVRWIVYKKFITCYNSNMVDCRPTKFKKNKYPPNALSCSKECWYSQYCSKAKKSAIEWPKFERFLKTKLTVMTKKRMLEFKNYESN